MSICKGRGEGWCRVEYVQDREWKWKSASARILGVGALRAWIFELLRNW